MADPALRHHRDRDRLDDGGDETGIAHPGDTALPADVGGHPLQGHHRDRARVLGDLGLLGGNDVHDDATLEHLGQPGLDLPGPLPIVHPARALRHRIILPLAAGNSGPTRGRRVTNRSRGSGRDTRIVPQCGGLPGRDGSGWLP